MLKFLNLQSEIFGLDINDLSLKIVKIKRKGKGFALVSFCEVSIKPDIVKEGVIQDQKSLIKIIKSALNMIKGEQLATNSVILSLPEEKSFFQVIQMPQMTEEELKSAVPFEVENYIPLSLDKVYLDFQVIDPHKDSGNINHLDLLINVMPKTIVDSYVFCVKQTGLIPHILEVESQAIVRSLIKRGETISPTIFIDLGQNNTSFIIFFGDSIRFTCSLSIYSQQLTQAISDNLKIDINDAEKLKVKYGLIPAKEKEPEIAEIIKPILHDLVAEIKKYNISFHKNYPCEDCFLEEKKITKIILSGGGANLKGLPNFLSQELKIPVELGNPLVNIITPKIGPTIPYHQALSFTTAIGLALRGVEGIDPYNLF